MHEAQAYKQHCSHVCSDTPPLQFPRLDMRERSVKAKGRQIHNVVKLMDSRLLFHSRLVFTFKVVAVGLALGAVIVVWYCL